MKYSFMSFSCPELPLEEMLAAAKQFGYDGVEPRTSAKHKHGVEPETTSKERAEIRRKVAAGGIALSCIATSHQYANPAAARAQVEGTIKSAQLAADVAAPRIRVFGGLLPQGVGRDQAIASLADCLTEISKAIEKLPVTVCLETHDDWCDPTHVAEVMRRVSRPNIAVNWDIMHPVFRAGKTIEESFKTLKPWIRHVHFHDGITEGEGLRLMPVGMGRVDHRRAVQLLKQSGYDGYLSGEWSGWEPYEQCLPRELAEMRRYEAE